MDAGSFNYVLASRCRVKAVLRRATLPRRFDDVDVAIDDDIGERVQQCAIVESRLNHLYHFFIPLAMQQAKYGTSAATSKWMEPHKFFCKFTGAKNDHHNLNFKLKEIPLQKKGLR